MLPALVSHGTHIPVGTSLASSMHVINETMEPDGNESAKSRIDTGIIVICCGIYLFMKIRLSPMCCIESYK